MSLLPKQELIRQGGQFLAVGAIQLLLDWGVFVSLSALSFSAVSSNIGGRICGAIVGFWLNRTYTFAPRESKRVWTWEQFIRFLIMWLALTCISSLMIQSVHEHIGLRWTWLAKPIVEASLALVSFFLSRSVVYR